MVDRRSIKEIIEEWIRKHPSRKSPEAGRRNIYFELQAIIILVSVFSLYHYPPVLGLPHADVLILDMTHRQNPSRAYFTDLLDRAHLSSLVYESVSVDMIRLIPTGNYRYIILWGHSGLNDMATTEPYSPFHHILEQLTGEVGNYLVQGKEYFSLQPGLVMSMKGTLSGSPVLLMGCNTLTQHGLASAFLRKGSSLVIGWTGLVSVAVTDMVVMTLFQKILQDHEPLSQALAETNRLLESMGMTNILTSFKPQ